MDADAFWELIERSRQETSDQDARLEWLLEQLTRRPAAEIVDFQDWVGARTTLLSIWASQSSSPAASAWVRRAAWMRAQVPSVCQRRRQPVPLLVGELESPVHACLYRITGTDPNSPNDPRNAR
jgi:hypothetical protein